MACERPPNLPDVRLAVLSQMPLHSPLQSRSVTRVHCGVWQGHEKAVRDVDLPVDFHGCNLFASCSLDKTVHPTRNSCWTYIRRHHCLSHYH